MLGTIVYNQYLFALPAFNLTHTTLDIIEPTNHVLPVKQTVNKKHVRRILTKKNIKNFKSKEHFIY